ncbi:hypothetical protein ACHQM5_018565 [Ranunculus cassubicifolius]
MLSPPLMRITSRLILEENFTESFQRYLHLHERMLVLKASLIGKKERVKERISSGNSLNLSFEL